MVVHRDSLTVTASDSSPQQYHLHLHPLFLLDFWNFSDTDPPGPDMTSHTRNPHATNIHMSQIINGHNGVRQDHRLTPFTRRSPASPHGHSSSQVQPQPQPQPQVYTLGSREDVEQDDYQSPLSIMYGRAWERYRTAEMDRQAAREVAIHDQMGLSDHPSLATLLSGGTENRIAPSAPVPSIRQRANFHSQFYGTSTDEGLPLLRGDLRESRWYSPPAYMAPFVHLDGHPAGSSGNSTADNPVDRQSNRPEPLKKEDMTISIACKMCLEQKIDTLIEPCMHLAICRWCSEVWQQNARESRQADPGIQHAWKCPVCRRAIAQVRRVYF